MTFCGRLCVRVICLHSPLNIAYILSPLSRCASAESSMAVALGYHKAHKPQHEHEKTHSVWSQGNQQKTCADGLFYLCNVTGSLSLFWSVLWDCAGVFHTNSIYTCVPKINIFSFTACALSWCTKGERSHTPRSYIFKPTHMPSATTEHRASKSTKHSTYYMKYSLFLRV